MAADQVMAYHSDSTVERKVQLTGDVVEAQALTQAIPSPDQASGMILAAYAIFLV